MTLDVVDLQIRGRISDGNDPAMVLRGVNLQVQPGEYLAIIGESGAGKSMLLNTLAGNYPPGWKAAGRISLSGATGRVDLLSPGRTRVRGRLVGCVPQNPATSFTPVRRVGAQLAEAVRAAARGERKQRVARVPLPGVPAPGHPHLPAGDTPEHVHQLAAAVGLDHALLARFPHELSGGQITRAAIAAALACHPQLLLADEPTNGLDADSSATIAAMFRTYARAGHTVVMVTHDLDLAKRNADTIAVLHQGSIVEHGPAATVLDSPTHLHTRRLVEARYGNQSVPNRRSSGGASAVPLPLDRGAVDTGRDSCLRLRGVAASYDSAQVFDGLDLTIARGAITGLTGPSGAGKSTLGTLAALIRRPSSGTIDLDGQAITGAGLSLPTDVRRQVAWLQQQPRMAVDPRFSLEHAIALPAQLAGLPVNVEALAERVGLSATLLTRKPHEVSAGQLQRCAVARALALQPRYMICDEMTAMLDAVTAREVLTLLAREIEETGLGVLFISHDWHLLQGWASDIFALEARAKGIGLHRI
jgi:peptide/nickel transport system ATP-binding protein